MTIKTKKLAIIRRADTPSLYTITFKRNGKFQVSWFSGTYQQARKELLKFDSIPDELKDKTLEDLY